MAKPTCAQLRLRNASTAAPRYGLCTALVLAVSACAGAKLYDKSKDELAAGAKKNYSQIRVTEVVDQALENYDELRDESLKIVASEASLRRERAILDIAAGDRSLAEWLIDRQKEMMDLGFKSAKEIRSYTDKLTKLRNFRNRVVGSASRLRALAGFKSPPDCSATLSTKQAWFQRYLPDDKDQQGRFVGAYNAYLRDCRRLTRELPVKVAGGTLVQAINEQLNVQARRAAELKEAAERLEAHKDTKEAAKASPSEDARDKLEAATKALEDALKNARELLVVAGVDERQQDYMDNIGVLLVAIGSGKIDEDSAEEDPVLRDAATVLTEVYSLTLDAAAFLEAGRKPSVSGLLIELNHQKILSDRAREFAGLAERSLALHQQKVDALSSYARLLLQVQFRLCNFAVLMDPADQKWPGWKCETLGTEEVPLNPYEPERKTLLCRVGPEDGQLALPDCALKQTWRTALQESKVRARRQLYEAVYLYAEALEARTHAAAVDFKLIDIEHRRAAVANRSALLAWDNLVEVPVSTLAAYHASGIKPDSLAQAIATLLGLTAVAVGASQ